MKKTIITLALLTCTMAGFAQQNVNYVDIQNQLDLKNEMLLEASIEFNQFGVNMYKGMALGLIATPVIVWGSQNSSRTPIMAMGIAVGVIGAFKIVSAPWHIKKGAAYLEASANGVRITF